MSQETDGLHGFFDWLLTPSKFPELDNQWKRRHLKKLSRAIERLRNSRVVRPSKRLDDAIALLRTELKMYRDGFAYVVPKSGADSKGQASHRFLTSAKLKGASERRFVAVLVARHLYPERSAYEKVREELKKRGCQVETEALRQECHRFVESLNGDRTTEIFDVAFSNYTEFRCEELATTNRNSELLKLSASEHDLFYRIAEGWLARPRKKAKSHIGQEPLKKR